MSQEAREFESFDLLTRRRTQVVLAVTGATLIAAIETVHIVGNLRDGGIGVSYRRVLIVEVLQWVTWAAFIFVVTAIERKNGVRRLGWARGLANHAFAAVVSAVVANAIVAPIVFSLGLTNERNFSALIAGRMAAKLPQSLAVYALIAGATWLVMLARDRAIHVMRASRLERDLTEARLLTLQAQLQPHFLFNTLNLLSGLVRQSQNARAVETIAQLSDLLRRSLDGADRPTVTLEEELDWLRRYLAIQKLRFGELLSVEEDISPAARTVPVPAFLLQPRVENAVTHGLRNAAGGIITLRATVSEGQLRLDVEDDGSGVSHGAKEGIGLGLTRSRLATQYGTQASLTIGARPQGGTVVHVVLPIQPARWYHE